MIVGGQTEARAQLSPTIIDYLEPFDQGLSDVWDFTNGFKMNHNQELMQQYNTSSIVTLKLLYVDLSQ